MTPSLPPGDADQHVVATLSNSKGEAALWWSRVPELPGEKLGVIGAFAADSESAAREVLQRSCEILHAQGCTRAIGPMDGNTWRKYRFVTEAGTEPPFFLEPSNPSEWPEWWRRCGFGVLAEYYSSATADLTTRDARLKEVEARMREISLRIRPLNTSEYGEELNRIYDISVVSFADNFLYTPLPREAFVSQYLALGSRVRPEFVLLAEHDGKAVGYVFAIPDYAQAQRGETLSTIVVKTLAVLPGRAYAGLGALLLSEVHAAAHRAGYRRAIHALMHESNKSRNLSAHYAVTIRRYSLFSRQLA